MVNPDNPATPTHSPQVSEHSVSELGEKLSRIERRDWWVWGYTIVVIVVLTGAVISMAVPSLSEGAKTIFDIKVSQAVFGLVTLVLLFNVYTIYQEILIKRLRRQLAEKQGHSEILRTLAMVDPLTGLYNRRFAEERVAAEISRALRKDEPLTVMALDLNNFKEINDTYGHPAGDLVLQQFATRLNQAIRGSDLAVRMGGDEFLVILPDCTTTQLQRVLARLGPLEVNWQGTKIPVTFSAGSKQYRPGEEPEHLLAGADQALYNNKRESKNLSTLQTAFRN